MSGRTSASVDVLAILSALEFLAGNRLIQKRSQIDKDRRAGREPHPDTEVKAERAEYLRENARKAHAAVSELIAAAAADCRLSEEAGLDCRRLRKAIAKATGEQP